MFSGISDSALEFSRVISCARGLGGSRTRNLITLTITPYTAPQPKAKRPKYQKAIFVFFVISMMILSVEDNDKLQRRRNLPLSRDQGLAPFLTLYLSKIIHLLPSVIWPPSHTSHSHLSDFEMKKKKEKKIGFIIETQERPCNPPVMHLSQWF